MAKGISVSESDRKRVRGAIMAFVEAGKYARDKEPKSMSWLMGVIGTSSLHGGELMEIFQHIGNFPWGAEEKMRLQEVRRELEGAIKAGEGKGFIK